MRNSCIIQEVEENTLEDDKKKIKQVDQKLKEIIKQGKHLKHHFSASGPLPGLKRIPRKSKQQDLIDQNPTKD